MRFRKSCKSAGRGVFAQSQIRRGAMSNAPRSTKDWLRAVASHLSVSPSELARLAGRSPSTLTRYLNDNTGEAGISERTLADIAKAAGVAVMEFPYRPQGFADREAETYVFADPGVGTSTDRAVRELVAGRNGRVAWVMRSHALELSGILPGDILVVDMNLQPRPRDIVCAQLYDWAGDRAETVFRIYQTPWLMTHAAREGPAQPVAVDGQAVVIKGVVTATLRARAA